MPRFLLALLIVLGLAVFAAPASAFGHAGGHGAHRTGPTAEAAAGHAALPVTATAATTWPVAVVSATTGAPLPEVPCDHDCGDGSAMGSCSCMAACIAMALPVAPGLAPPVAAAGPRPSDAAPWRPTAHVPPTPPPRA